MSEQNNVQRAKDAYAAFGRGDIDGVLETMAEDIEWVIPGPSDLPNSGTTRGKPALREWFGVLAQTVDYHRFEPYEFISQGDTVVVLLHIEGTMRHNNRSVRDESAHVLTYRAGNLVRFQAFEDTAAQAAAYRGE